jgi:hypothetical protein
MKFRDATETPGTVSGNERRGQSDVEPGTIRPKEETDLCKLPDQTFPVYIIRENPDTEAHLHMISWWRADLPSYEFKSGK